MVSNNGLEADPKKVTAIVNWLCPVTVNNMRSFLGFTNHYCRFIHKYAHIEISLNILTSVENTSKKNKRVDWNTECDEAICKLKDLCSQTLILAYADYTKPFKLQTDIYILGLVAILYQTKEDGTAWVIIYSSLTLNKSKRRYPADKLEFLALQWAIIDQFYEYLHVGTFDISTDNSLLSYV